MPNCFHLVRKSAPEEGPVSLNLIDEELCGHFQAPIHPTQYFHQWYDVIGFRLALGKSFADQRRFHVEAAPKCEAEGNHDDAVWHREMVNIINWLDNNFTADAWAEVGRGR